MASVPWTAYRDPNADQGFENDKMTSGGLPETMPEPKYQSGGGNLTPETFGFLPKSQREAAMHRGMKGMEYGQNQGDVQEYGEGEAMKHGDEQAQRMMNDPIPSGSEHYQGESEEKNY